MRLLSLVLALLAAVPLFGGDLTVGWISRQPEIAYVWQSARPAVEGWPEIGEQVTWRGHVRSWMDADTTVAYRWTLDGIEVAHGETVIAANAVTAIDLPLAWSFRRQRLALELDPANAVAEESERNNRLEVFTDALSVGFWVEQSLYDWFRLHQQDLGIGSTSWENWAQRHIEQFNDMAAMAVYPETPHGVLDRWRLQKIVIVPDGALPLVKPPNFEEMDGEPNGMTHPDLTDRTVDLQIGFRASTLASFKKTTGATPQNPFYVDLVTLHELGHARYLTDVYAFSVSASPPGKVVEVPAPLPYFTPETGLMNSQMTYIDRYSAVLMNRIAGRRAVAGNYNDPENANVFLNDLPAENRVTIRDASGNALPHAKVEIYQSALFHNDSWYATYYDNHPDLTLETDDEGRVLLGRNPFSSDRIYHWWRGSNAVAIVKTEQDGVVRWGFLEVRLFHMAYWRGEVDFAEHELVVGPRFCTAREVSLKSPAWDAVLEGPSATLRWSAVASTTRYRIYVARAGEGPRLAATTTSAEVTIPVSGRSYWWVEADVEGCPTIRSYANRLVAPQAAPAPKRRRAM